MGKLISLVLVVAMSGALALGINWVIWAVWCWALPQVWPSGPTGLIAPSYWLFVAVLFLLSVVGRTMFGSKDD